MLRNLAVRKVYGLPEDIRGELLQAAIAEGFKPLSWLIREWEAETNRFSLPGEALYEARAGTRLVGICGLNQDPYREDENIGRLRRLYVHPDFRRMGVGKQLVSKAIGDAVGQFDLVRLRTFDDRSAQFFETLGFLKVEGEAGASHIFAIDPSGAAS